MKKIFVLVGLVTLFLGFSIKEKKPSSFESQLSYIASSFVDDVMDEDACEELMRDADRLADVLADEIEESGSYSVNERQELKALKKEAEAMEDFISVVGDVSNHAIDMEDFNLANRRVRANVAVVERDKFCVQVIKVSIGNYVSYLAENTSSVDYSIDYKYRVVGSRSWGSGESWVGSLGARHLWSNRDRSNQKSIIVDEIDCN